LNGLFALLRTFKANDPGIFGEFERLAKGFIDAASAGFPARIRRAGQADMAARGDRQPHVHHDRSSMRAASARTPQPLAFV
jgi:hypothetical protein